MKKKIIIIGAGMAGIMAGKTLQDAGFNVVLLEARARVGGRTHTDHSLGNAVDLGASWIHGTEGNPLTPLAKSLNITLGYTDFLNRSITAVQAYADDGTPLNQADYAKGQIEANAAFYTSTGSLLFAPPKDGRSLKDWVQHGFPKPDNLSPAAEQGFYYYSLIRTEYTCASDWEKIDWELGRNYVGLPGGDHLVYGGGFNTITDHLAQALDIQLNTAVSGITTTEDGVRLQTTAGQMNSDFVVLTVPLGVLKSSAIHFDPPLPEEKTAVIQRIGFGNYEKLALRFDKFYWPKEAQRFNYLSDGEPSLYHAWLNLGHYTGDPVLVSYHAGRRAQRINQMSDGELI